MKIREQCGSPAGFQMHLYLGEETCADCRAAKAAYNKRNKVRRDLGLPSSDLIPVLGTVRRLQALMFLGWPVNYVLDRAGVRRRSIVRFEATERINKPDADKIARVYDELSMVVPTTAHGLRRNEITRAQKYGRERSYVPPLAWDDIDNDVFNPAHQLRRIA